MVGGVPFDASRSPLASGSPPRRAVMETTTGGRRRTNVQLVRCSPVCLLWRPYLSGGTLHHTMQPRKQPARRGSVCADLVWIAGETVSVCDLGPRYQSSHFSAVQSWPAKANFNVDGGVFRAVPGDVHTCHLGWSIDASVSTAGDDRSGHQRPPLCRYRLARRVPALIACKNWRTEMISVQLSAPFERGHCARRARRCIWPSATPGWGNDEATTRRLLPRDRLGAGQTADVA